VRSDRTSTNWALLSYEGSNSNNVALVGKGEGGVPELESHLNDDIVGYALVRLVEKFDESDTVKFVYIRWVGENIHRMLRARLGTHSGAIKEIIGQYHVDVEASTKSEISEDIVVGAVRKTSGTASRVLDSAGGSPSSGTRGSPSFRGSSGSPSMRPSGVPKTGSNVAFEDEDAIREAVREVRSDASPLNWVLITYNGPNSSTLVLAGKGEGGSEELLSHLKDDSVGYGLLRQKEKFEGNERVMFAYVNWTGENIHRMLRARLGTHSGTVKELFSPFHVDINASDLSEISPDIINSTIRNTMGTATRVRD